MTFAGNAKLKTQSEHAKECNKKECPEYYFRNAILKGHGYSLIIIINEII